MKHVKPTNLIVICAPSGTGKTTLLARLKVDRPQLNWSVSCTTRPIRPGEKDGVDYHYIDKSDFEPRIGENEFIEGALVRSNYHRTSQKFVEQGLSTGKALLFDLDVQGSDSMKRLYGDKARVIFIQPPSLEELGKRLRGRGTDAEHVIVERLNNARKEIARAKDFDFLVTNDDMERAYQELIGIIDNLLGGH